MADAFYLRGSPAVHSAGLKTKWKLWLEGFSKCPRVQRVLFVNSQ